MDNTHKYCGGCYKLKPDSEVHLDLVIDGKFRCIRCHTEIEQSLNEIDKYRYISIDPKEPSEDIIRRMRDANVEEAFDRIFDKPDRIDSPDHYTKGTIECIDFINDKELNFMEGNIVKYVVRYKHKNGLEDLKKAEVYLKRLINLIED